MIQDEKAHVDVRWDTAAAAASSSSSASSSSALWVTGAQPNKTTPTKTRLKGKDQFLTVRGLLQWPLFQLII
jgi:hypothetical protein